jgi:hypothetical protein
MPLPDGEPPPDPPPPAPPPKSPPTAPPPIETGALQHAIDINWFPFGITCRRCGYDLRNLPITGVCPECGYEIARTLKAHRLKYVDPAWIQALARGYRLVFLGYLLLIAGIAIALIYETILHEWYRLGGQDPGYPLEVIAGSMFLLPGLWLATRAEPDCFRPTHAALASWLIRAGPISVLLALPVIWILVATGQADPGPTAAGLWTLGLLAVGSSLVIFWLRTRTLAHRIPDAGLGGATLLTAWATGLATMSCLCCLPIESLHFSKAWMAAFSLAPIPLHFGLALLVSRTVQRQLQNI